MPTSHRSAESIIAEAEDLLRTAQFGREDMNTRPGRARSGLRNAVVFGRNATWALQNLRNVIPEFDEWYNAKQEEMKADPLMRYFRDLRTTIEKKASTPTTVSVYIKSFSAKDIERFKPAPPEAVGFFIGDQSGGAGWEVKKPDGSVEKYYVELPDDIGAIDVHLADAPEEVAQGRTASELVEQYLSRVGAVIREARQKFAPNTSPTRTG
jgi:hypothetical protein